jgi:putative DNA primase/helicase
MATPSDNGRGKANGKSRLISVDFTGVGTQPEPVRDPLQRIRILEGGDVRDLGIRSRREADVEFAYLLLRLHDGNRRRVEHEIRLSPRITEMWDDPRGEMTHGETILNEAVERYARSCVDEQSGEGGLKVVRLSEVQAIEPRFLIRPYLPQGCVSLLVGDPGTGKSLVALSILAHLTTGKSLLGTKVRPMNGLFLSNEDPTHITRFRFDRAKGNPDRVMIESYNGKIFTLEDVESLERMTRLYQPGIIVIDSVMSHLGSAVDSYKANQVAAVITPLAGIAERSNVVILCLMHLRKAEASRVLYRVQASIGFTASARSVLALDYDPESADSRILCHIKSNNAANGMSQSLSVADGVVQWNGESSLKAEDLFGNESTGENRRARKQAEAFLREILVDGPMPSDDVKQLAKAQGISERTLTRAKNALGVTSKKMRDGRWAFEPPKNWSKNANRGS